MARAQRLAFVMLGLFAAPAPAQALLDGFPIRGTEEISAAALGDDVLVAWNSTGPFPFSIYWTILQSDGGLSKQPDAGALGEFSGQPVHVVAAPDAGVWMVAHPDKSGGGVTGGARISSLTRASLDGYGQQYSNLTFTSRVRAAWAQGRWWLVEYNGTTSSLTVSAAGVATAAVSEPELPPSFELAGSTDRLFVAWVSDGGVPTIEARVSGLATGRAHVFDAGAIATNVAVANGVVLLVWTDPSRLSLARFGEDLSAIDPVRTLDTGDVFAPKVSFDGADFIVVWERRASRGSLGADLRLARVHPMGAITSPVTIRSASSLRAPDVAGVRPGEFVVAWLEGVPGGTGRLPFVARFTDSGVIDAGSAVDAGAPDAGAPDAGTPDAGTPDAGTPDAGTPDAGAPDAGAPDAGTPDAGTPDAGTADAGTPDAGTDAGTPDAGAPDADAGPPDAGEPDAGAPDAGVGPRSYGIACGCGPDGTTWLAWLGLALLSATRSRGAASARRRSLRQG